MTFEELSEIVTRGESETLELKRSTAQLTEACHSLCALLNNRGGSVIIGVESSGTISGQEVSDDTLRKIGSHLQRFEPSPPVEISRVRLGHHNREVIVLEASWVLSSQPYTYDGRSYQRIGSTTQRMPQDRYQSLLLRRAHSTERWENAQASNCSTKDLDLVEIRRAIRVGIDSGRIPEMDIEEPEVVLTRLGLVRDSQLLNAAVALFGTATSIDYPQLTVRMARFRGYDKREFVDSQQADGMCSDCWTPR